MANKDNLDSIVEKLGFYVARIIGRKNKSEFEKALQIIDEAMLDLVKIDTAYINAIQETELLSDLNVNKNFDIGQHEVVAELLNEAADIYNRQQDGAKSRSAYIRALSLFQHIEATDESLNVDRRHKITRIKGILGN